LRFGEFEGEWEEKKLGEVAETTGGGTPDTTIEEYWNGEIQWFTPSEIKSNYVSKSERTITKLGLNKSSAKLLPAGTILVTTRATIGEVAIATEECSTNQGFQSFIVNKDINNIFIANWVKQNKNELIRRAKGSTFAEISKSEIERIPILLPSTPEQTKIASLLQFLDHRLSTQREIIEELKSLKKALRNRLYQQIIKVEKTEQIANLLNYEQPTNYIVTNTDYSNDCSQIPVLTANKAFILGYTGENFGVYNKGKCIIFDDFTMDLKYVDFPFKVKSSAIKILTAKQGVNLKFIYEYLSFLKLTSTDHKRHYISEIESMYISVPKIDIQNNIANILSTLDTKISLEIKQYDLLVKQKKYLLQQMFI
jgi:type I restriction enzyme S subunit